MNTHQSEPHLRIAQQRVASYVIELVHGKEALKRAKMMTEALFNNSFDDLDEKACETLSHTLKQAHETKLVDALIELTLAQSKREAREFINNQAISINGKKIVDAEYVLSVSDALFGKYIILKRGKKLYGVVTLS
jgi:tyrosyl-tRNA synthetase